MRRYISIWYRYERLKARLRDGKMSQKRFARCVRILIPDEGDSAREAC